jgi:hypothetical protein
VRLGELVPWERNPRRISEANAARLLNSFDEFGQVEVLAIGPNNELYNGHQRLRTLIERVGPDYEVDARQASRALTEKEREKLTVYLHKGAAGDFDLEAMLRDWNPDELNSWGMPDLNTPDLAEVEWTGMPEFDGSPRAFAKVTVFMSCQEDVDAFAKLTGQPVTVDTVSIWYPEKQRVDLDAEQWASDK